MNIEELKRTLDELGVPPRWYVINGSLKSNVYVLNYVHTYWEYFYFDERGNENGYKKFRKEDEACDYLFNKLKTLFEYHNG